jgi:hypothetical protein
MRAQRPRVHQRLAVALGRLDLQLLAVLRDRKPRAQRQADRALRTLDGHRIRGDSGCDALGQRHRIFCDS